LQYIIINKKLIILLPDSDEDPFMIKCHVNC